MENPLQYSIVLVPFPFDDFTATKVRPALCLTSVIGKCDQIIIAFISSKIPFDLLQSDIVVLTGSTEWEDTGLKVDSVVRLHKMVTIPEKLIKRKLGQINENLQEVAKTKILKLFDS